MYGKEIATLQFYFQPVPQNNLREVEGLQGPLRIQSHSSFTSQLLKSTLILIISIVQPHDNWRVMRAMAMLRQPTPTLLLKVICRDCVTAFRWSSCVLGDRAANELCGFCSNNQLGGDAWRRRS
jgi:hypothetical protein